MLAHWWLGQSRREELTGPAAIRLEGLRVVLPGRRNLRAKKTAGVMQAVWGSWTSGRAQTTIQGWKAEHDQR